MTKRTVSRLFVGGILTVVAGATVAIAAIWIAIANDVFVMNGPDIIAIRGSALAWTTLGIGFLGGATMAAGAIAGVIASIGALVNTWRLESKAWFIGLLLLGIFSLGFFAMIAYVLVGPDGTAGPRDRKPSVNALPTPA
jgi:MFS family permease